MPRVLMSSWDTWRGGHLSPHRALRRSDRRGREAQPDRLVPREMRVVSVQRPHGLTCPRSFRRRLAALRTASLSDSLRLSDSVSLVSARAWPHRAPPAPRMTRSARPRPLRTPGREGHTQSRIAAARARRWCSEMRKHHRQQHANIPSDGSIGREGPHVVHVTPHRRVLVVGVEALEARGGPPVVLAEDDPHPPLGKIARSLAAH